MQSVVNSSRSSSGGRLRPRPRNSRLHPAQLRQLASRPLLHTRRPPVLRDPARRSLLHRLPSLRLSARPIPQPGRLQYRQLRQLYCSRHGSRRRSRRRNSLGTAAPKTARPTFWRQAARGCLRRAGRRPSMAALGLPHPAVQTAPAARLPPPSQPPPARRWPPTRCLETRSRLRTAGDSSRVLQELTPGSWPAAAAASSWSCSVHTASR